ncbi:hypothetical protein KGM_210230 [Danaus plexippus plexippus]|uniref:Uncharacterized protein n=1 Tax=Danaus plexippus plexippus TaxID=278856 RepID=A0A212EWF5_DANPL|nr:hypothetical protein KGM_210230 [Danaus plexippus plexippus]
MTCSAATVTATRIACGAWPTCGAPVDVSRRPCRGRGRVSLSEVMIVHSSLMGVVGWSERSSAPWLADMRSKQVPTSTTSARRRAAFITSDKEADGVRRRFACLQLTAQVEPITGRVTPPAIIIDTPACEEVCVCVCVCVSVYQRTQRSGAAYTVIVVVCRWKHPLHLMFKLHISGQGYRKRMYIGW